MISSVRKRAPFAFLRTLSLAILSFLATLPFVRLDPDLHHDGLMATAASAVTDFRFPNADFFAQYGPVTPLLQSSLVFLGIPSFLALRIFTALATATIVFLIADLPRVAPNRWRIDPLAASLASLSWFLLGDGFLGVPPLPWSSHIATLLVMAVVWLAARGFKPVCDDDERPSRGHLYLAGIVASSVPFTRISVGIVFIVSLSVVALFLRAKTDNPQLRLAGTCLIRGQGFGFIIQLLFMTITGSFAPWVKQAVVWPLEWQDAAVAANRPLDVLATAISDVAIDVSLVVALGAFLITACSAESDRFTTRNYRDLNLIAVVIIVGAYLSVRTYATPPRTRSLIFAAVGLGGDHGSRARQNVTWLFILAVAGLLVGLILLIFLVVNRAETGQIQSHLGNALLAIASLATMSQIWPVPDSRHLWWGAAPPVLLLYSWLSLGMRKRRFGLLAAVPSLVCSLLVAVSVGRAYTALERFPGPDGTALEGMLVGYSWAGPTDRVSLKNTIDGLRTQAQDDRIIFLTNDGFWAGYEDHFQSADPYYTSWGSPAGLKARLEGVSLVVVDVDARGTYSSDLLNSGFREVEIIGHLAYYRRD
jgi:hypothetical protein